MTRAARGQWSVADLPSDERVIRACLLRAVEPANQPVLRLAQQLGVRDLLEAITAGAVASIDVDGLAGRIQPGCGEADLAAAAKVGARLVIPSDPEWPAPLSDLDRVGLSSFGVYVRGAVDLAAACERAVSIVGTRAATGYGLEVASELACALAERGWGVVSGLAYGIDAAAHRGALAAGPHGAPTIAVLACGIDTVYPSSHEALHAQIAASGAIVTEQPPGAPPFRTRFLVRNRLIAALSAGTVVVEAAARSGARSTAKYAGTLGRSVMAVPGPITSSESVGCHQLLRDDPAVALITRVDDVIEAVGPIGALSPRAQGETSVRDRLSPTQRAVLDGMPAKSAAPAERIAVASGVSVLRVVDALTELALGGLVEPDDGGWRLTEAARAERRPAKRPQPEGFDLDWW